MNNQAPTSVSGRTIPTSRVQTFILEANPAGNIPVILVHGNVSSSRFYQELLTTLPAQFHGIAPDLRGFGDTEAQPIDATRGLSDFADDLAALVQAMALTDTSKVHFVGWSMGAGVVMQYAIDHPQDVASLTFISPLSPYGFGGTKDTSGALCWPDAAGSGGGTANPDYVRLLSEGDRGSDSPNSPRNVMNAFYFKPPFKVAPEVEEAYMDAMLKMRLGADYYPGDSSASDNWPGVAPAGHGINNAMAPNYCNLSAFATITPQPTVLWVRGADDQIVSDNSFLDFGTLGKLGFVPGWPGEERYPSQPMVSQMRAVLDAYRANGGSYRELVMTDCGHSPHLEKPNEFRGELLTFLSSQ